MMRLLATTAAFALILSGCANMTHLTRKKNFENQQMAFTDAKQRVVTKENGQICAEPSPDALSILAAQGSGNISTPSGLTAAQSVALAESGASIGLRTQSIQLLRDHMYRVCELSQTGKITPTQAAVLHNRFQSNTIAILAIEQLTGVARPPAIVLGGGANSGNAEAMRTLAEGLTAQQGKVNAAQEDANAKKSAADSAIATQASAQAAYDATPATPPDPKAAKLAELEKAKKDTESAATALKSAQDLLEANKTGLQALQRAMALAQASGSASASGSLETLASSRPEDMTAVATAVQNIVAQAMAQSHSADLCAVLLSDPNLAQASAPADSFLGYCRTSANEWKTLLMNAQ